MEPIKSYHIYTHANGSENLFRNAENFRYFLSRCKVFLSGVADMPVYCLMPNHLHLLVRIKSELELKEYFSSKKKKDLTGLAERKYRRPVRSDTRLERLTILQFSHLFNAYSKAYNKVYSKEEELSFYQSI
jgi:putative transposase